MGIVQRRGLNKLRHVELDVLWIQEQQARRRHTLQTFPGTQNPPDMMTKNIAQAHLDQYLDILNLRYVDGRAAIAQNLHLVGETSDTQESTSALLSEDLMPLRRCGTI